MGVHQSAIYSQREVEGGGEEQGRGGSYRGVDSKGLGALRWALGLGGF